MYSFDVFDTLITRSTATPKGIFMLMQDQIKGSREYPPFLKDNFYELRVESEKLAKEHAVREGKQEITLGDIYKALATNGCITEEQQEELKNLEIETEYNNVLAITKNVDLLKQLVSRGERVVLISDMYLSEKVIRRMIEKIDSVFEKIPVYVSSEYGVTKGGGGLFRIVKNAENVEYADWIHYGDNEYADINAANRLGIKAVQMVSEETKEYEQPEKDLYHQLSVGVSKYIRSSGIKGVSGEIGSSLAGPILYPYVKWVLEESLSMGISRLYFVARDGWILQQIADKIIKIEQYQIETHYIYGSRKAWRLPSFDGSIENFDRLIKLSSIDGFICLNDYAKLFQVEVQELKAALSDEYAEMSGERKLLKIHKDNIIMQLRENENFRNYLLRNQGQNRRLVIKYLMQELDVSDGNFAFVELAGTGFTQKCLADIIGNFYRGEIRNFYFKLDSIQENGRCTFINFLPSTMKRSYMVELLCRAPHGQTNCYVEKGGLIEPALESYEGELIRAYGLDEYRSSVLAYVEQMENCLIQNDISYIVRIGIIREYIRIIAENPPKRIAEYFSHMPFSSTGNNSARIEFAPPVTRRQLRKIYFWCDEENLRNVYHGNTLDYALTIFPEAERYGEKCKKYRNSVIGKWLTGLKRYFCTHQMIGTFYFCPWEFLAGNIVIYGAGKVGQDYVKQAKQRYAKCENLLWVDKNYIRLQEKGFDVKPPEEIANYYYDRIIVAIHDNFARQEIKESLQEMGVAMGKIYYG